ncbi:MAG: formate/nitrite transporter family protein [Porticoccus sp.]|nr:formate/nitrite transporter family protein [Porticoccus sp.]MBQ0807479.1 formate/nitrite transporter family protein [Porticoccus sp.]
MSPNNDMEAYSPKQIAQRVEAVGVTKANLDTLSTLLLAILAGAFISFGALLYTFIIHDSSFGLGLTRLAGGLGFCLGLILVVVAGAELFTGNNLMTIACVSRRISLAKLLRNWALVFLGNLLGALGTVVLISISNYWLANDGRVGEVTVLIANSKVNLGFAEAFARGVLCNVLVCLAIWLCFAGHSVTDKILAIVFPITAFVALGFEHSVANMYFIPAGMMALGDPVVLAAIPEGTDLSNLNIWDFLVNNLLPVTLGNMVGGGILVGVVYWVIYLRNEKKS